MRSIGPTFPPRLSTYTTSGLTATVTSWVAAETAARKISASVRMWLKAMPKDPKNQSASLEKPEAPKVDVDDVEHGRGHRRPGPARSWKRGGWRSAAPGLALFTSRFHQ